MFDSHCHLDMPAFDRDREAVVERARAAGVTRLLVPGVSPDTWDRTASMRRFEGVIFGLGLHPQMLPELAPGELERGLAELPARLRDSGAVAVGECGLDKPTAVPMAEQRRILRRHLEVARELDLPVILHCLGAHGPMLEELEAFGPIRGVMHSYSGSAELVPRYAALGLHFSFAGVITWEGARKPLLAAKAVPAHRLLVETDSPDQAPRPRELDRNEPSQLPRVIAALEALRGAALQENGLF